MAFKDEAPDTTREFYHEGIWFPKMVLESSITALSSFEVRSDDVWIVTYPKSGTHWMMEIVGLILNDGDPEKVDRTWTRCIEMSVDHGPASKTTGESDEGDKSREPFLETLNEAPSPRVIQSHLRLARFPRDMTKKAKVIYLARNPKDVVTSWFHFTNKNLPHFTHRSWEGILKSFLEGETAWGPWPEHVREFWEIRDEEGVLFLFYEDILRDPLKHVKMVAQHLGRPLSADVFQRVVENSSVDQMKQTYRKVGEIKDRNCQVPRLQFISKGVAGRWKNHFTVAQNELFDDWYRKQMEGSDIPISFE
ncbi:sulfotransferase 1A1-like [Diadema antillarum]|uniref:sulfotransferase 1A1-like n=1 Tax=Diadema antillarum TaxID=105358 RepID=UPI003A843234